MCTSIKSIEVQRTDSSRPGDIAIFTVGMLDPYTCVKVTKIKRVGKAYEIHHHGSTDLTLVEASKSKVRKVR